jgi:hypothetical protein
LPSSIGIEKKAYVLLGFPSSYPALQKAFLSLSALSTFFTFIVFSSPACFTGIHHKLL